MLWFAFKFVPLNHWKQQWTIFKWSSIQLWFAFKFVPLNHWKQQRYEGSYSLLRCDLLSNLYLWTIGNNTKMLYICSVSCDLLSNLYLWTIGNNFHTVNYYHARVVICFQICTFEPLETTKYFNTLSLMRCDLLSNLYLWTIGNNRRQSCPMRYPLWFAFKFVPLNHWKQRTLLNHSMTGRCDLLSNLYLWTIGNNNLISGWWINTLWFAFKFVPLNHWKQQLAKQREQKAVVICFQICTFEPLETTAEGKATIPIWLWFAFKFVPLNHWKQRIRTTSLTPASCDLLSNLYLWTIGNNKWRLRSLRNTVVICFQICTFEPLETTVTYKADRAE